LVYAESPSEISTVMIEHGYHCAASAPVVVAGRTWGAIVVVGAGEDALPAGTTERRLAAFAELLALALAGADAREQLLASRTRLVQVADDERRRLERDLHDGAQQRLVTLSQRLYLADKFLGDDPAKAREQLEICREEAREAIEDLRRLARGLHPPLLTEAGVAPAVRAIADRFHLPVTFSVMPTERFEAAVETAAYYLVSESLTNAGKHADATEIKIAIRRHPRRLVVQVSDDGVGGARPAGGGGLRGLMDRVEALGGNLSITSVPTRGTTVRAELPLPD
jgi:signal transduction histidine kinase